MAGRAGRWGRWAGLAAALALGWGWAHAYPDGAPWEAGLREEGCTRCHFGSDVVEGSESLRVLGLPAHLEPGARYRLTVELRADGMAAAGFLLTIRPEGGAGGALRPANGRAEVQGSQARSTRAGAVPEAPGLAEWELDWTVPTVLAPTLSLEVWANAADGDGSPLGDALHRRAWAWGTPAGEGAAGVRGRP